MAKVNSSDGSITGLIGSLVFVNFNGKKYVRMAPRTRSKNSWSDGQVAYRKKFREVCALWTESIPRKTRQIWELAAVGMNGFNLFVKTNMPALGSDGKICDWERFHFSAGKLLLPHLLKANRAVSDPEKVEVSWQNDPESAYSSTHDQLMMIVVRDGKFTAPIATGAIRRQGSAVIQLPSGTGTLQGIYLFFGNERDELYSVDQYFGL
jgi:hypothetical protein